MVIEKWRTFRKETGIHLDIAEFHRLYHLREEQGESVARIARGFVREFTEDTPEARNIRELDASFRQRKAVKIEADLFELRKRIAEAERKLALKVTKTASESKRIAEGKLRKAMTDLSLLRDNSSKANDYRAYPSGYLPALVRREGRLVLTPARDRLRPPGKPAEIDRQLDLYNARRDKLTGTFWRPLFGASHAILPAARFFENVEGQHGANEVLEFKPQDGSTMHIACLYAEWVSPSNPQDRLQGIAAITDEPPSEIAAAGHDRVPINLTWEAALKRLEPQGRSDAELQALLGERQRPYYEHREAA